MSLATRLKQLRKDANLNQTELGHIVGVSLSAIANYEAGEREPNSKIEIALADFFNVSIDYLRDHEKKSSFRNDTTMSANTIRITGRDGSYVER